MNQMNQFLIFAGYYHLVVIARALYQEQFALTINKRLLTYLLSLNYSAVK